MKFQLWYERAKEKVERPVASWDDQKKELKFNSKQNLKQVKRFGTSEAGSL